MSRNIRFSEAFQIVQSFGQSVRAGDVHDLDWWVVAMEAVHVALLLAGEGGGRVQGWGGVTGVGWSNLGRGDPTLIPQLRVRLVGRDGARAGAGAGVTVQLLFLRLPLIDGDDHPVVLAGDQAVMASLPLTSLVTLFALRRRNIL